MFEKIDEKITDTTFLSDEATAAVNDSLDAGVHDIDFAKYFEQVGIGRWIRSQFKGWIAQEPMKRSIYVPSWGLKSTFSRVVIFRTSLKGPVTPKQ